jgi:hypothetical protein
MWGIFDHYPPSQLVTVTIVSETHDPVDTFSEHPTGGVAVTTQITTTFRGLCCLTELPDSDRDIAQTSTIISAMEFAFIEMIP